MAITDGINRSWPCPGSSQKIPGSLLVVLISLTRFCASLSYKRGVINAPKHSLICLLRNLTHFLFFRLNIGIDLIIIIIIIIKSMNIGN